MGFGSYDESEQQNQSIETDNDATEGVNLHQNDHDGDVEYEMEASTDSLLDTLKDIKDDDEESS